MRRALGRSPSVAVLGTGLLLGVALLAARPSGGELGEVRTGDRLAYALTGVRLLTAPGRIVDPGVVVIRGGVIEAVGPQGKIPIPADARVFDLQGKTVHAAFVDPYVTVDRLAGKKPRRPADDEEGGEAPDAGRSSPSSPSSPAGPVRAERRVIETLAPKEHVLETYRRLGFAAVAAVPTEGILRGSGAVVSLGDGELRDRILDPDNGQYVSLEPARPDPSSFLRAEYPASKMGAVALVRQTFLDALWTRDAEAAYTRRPVGQARPATGAAPRALVPAAEGKETVVFEATDVLSLLRAGKIARERKLSARYVGAGDEYRLRGQVAALRPDLVVRLDFPRPERLSDETEWLDVPLERLRRIDRSPSNPKWLRDAGLTFSFTTHGLEDPEEAGKRVREAMARGLSFDDALAAFTTVPARQLGLSDRLGSIEPGKIANLAVQTGEPFAESSRVVEVWIDGRRYEIPEKKEGSGERVPREGPPPAGQRAENRPASARPSAADVRPFPPPDRGPVASPKAVLVRNTTVWTQGPAGTLEGADLLVVGGKVTGVGRGLNLPAGAVEIDGRGKHVTPGIIDAHSHSSTDGQVNEFTNNVSAEVRIQDVLDPFDVAIYRELAGGTTTSNVLHGSSNAIGGQNAIVKWRWGGGPDDLLFGGAPEGIKFALGENPRQANFANPRPRYPATRMGVANLIRQRFLAARDYRRRQEEYRGASKSKGPTPLPPAPDLQLEAIAEILEGKRQIHCHSYRKDEILEVLRIAEEFGVRIATLQHILEGYKVADEIARHGAGASSFSDWWAYKVEVYDAIPYNGALMKERGVLVSFNSDSDDFARRLNWEAAKAVRYGNVPPAEALAFVTINPARQLGIDRRVGSLEAGKDGDFVVWSGDPLSTTSIALETWVEGRRMFDRAADVARRPALEKEREDLVARAKVMLEAEAKRAREKSAAEALETREEAPDRRVPTRPPEEPERSPVSPTPRPTPAPTPPPEGRR